MQSIAMKAMHLALAGVLAGAPALGHTQTELEFYYPVAVGGPITKIVDGMVERFEQAHPDIDIKAVYAGTYQDSVAKALTAHKAGDAPDVAILLSTDMFTLIDEGAIIPFDP